MENQLPYALFENKLTSDPDDFTAQVQSVGTISDESLIDDMTSRGSTLTRAEAKSFLEEYQLSIRKGLLAGYSINTSLFNISPSIVGVFNGKEDSFDATRHAVRVNVTPGIKLRGMEAEFKPVKTETVKPIPSLLDFRDVASSLVNQVITPGSVGHLTGNRLNHDATDNQQGIFFVASDGTSVRVTTLVRHKPAELIFMIPSGLKPGNYHLEVRAVARNSKEVRTGRLLQELIVR